MLIAKLFALHASAKRMEIAKLFELHTNAITTFFNYLDLMIGITKEKDI